MKHISLAYIQTAKMNIPNVLDYPGRNYSTKRNRK